MKASIVKTIKLQAALPKQQLSCARAIVQIYLDKYCDSFRTQVKSDKGLKGTVVFARRCFTIKLIWKILQNIHSKETLMKSFFQLSHNCNFTEKEPHRSYFLMIFERLFIILFDVKRLVNLVKAWKKQAFARWCSTKKLVWKISQNSAKRNCDEVLFLVKSQAATSLK